VRAVLVPDDRTPSPQTIFALIPPPLPDRDALQSLLTPFAPAPTDSANASHEPTTQDKEQPNTNTNDATKIPLHTIPVPLQPPLNQSQAEKWTSTIWPVVYNPAAPRATIAPPPQILTRVHDSLKPRAGMYLALARRVAREAEQSGCGRRVGAVVVDPAIEARLEAAAGTESGGEGLRWTEAIVAVAGDARYARREGGAMSAAEVRLGAGPNPAARTYNADEEGGPELHALMRAVELVASRRRGEKLETLRGSPLEGYFLALTDGTVRGGEEETAPPEKCLKNQEGRPVATQRADGEGQGSSTPRIRSRSEGGYLCTDLDVYVSREPCLCCSMGMLLSRFRAVVFPRRGRMVTGGLASAPVVVPVADGDESDTVEESGQPERLYYGLHWRKELNWRALGFEYIEEGEDEERAYDEVSYHA
jgi:tRNA-specific adenosine deaminase 3